jgi:hypothetical protein
LRARLAVRMDMCVMCVLDLGSWRVVCVLPPFPPSLPLYKKHEPSRRVCGGFEGGRDEGGERPSVGLFASSPPCAWASAPCRHPL